MIVSPQKRVKKSLQFVHAKHTYNNQRINEFWGHFQNSRQVRKSFKKPNIDFLEMPTPMRESLCHLVRIELSHTSANPVVKIRSEPLIQVTHESFNPWWESHCATHLEALGSKILICLKINIYLQCNISIKFYKFEHFQRKYICKNCFFTRILQRKFVQSKLKFLKINFYIWI